MAAGGSLFAGVLGDRYGELNGPAREVTRNAYVVADVREAFHAHSRDTEAAVVLASSGSRAAEATRGVRVRDVFVTVRAALLPACRETVAALRSRTDGYGAVWYQQDHV